MSKKLVSMIITCAMLINIFAVMPINAFAASGSSKTYEKDGYSVTYIVGNEWDKSQTIYITLKNTGEEPILNWALKYDNIGSVSNIWNAYVTETTDEYVIVKNNGYNFEIAPDQSVSFGYTLSYEEKATPENFEIYSRRIQVKSGYDVEFNVTDDWYTGFQGEISVSNTSNEPIEAWMLSFDGNFDITNIWNAKLISNENRTYKTAAELWTNPINPGEKVSFGFSASKSATDNIIADNFKLTAVVIGESKLENDPEKEPEEDIDYELDSDNDGLPDYYEDILGTDKNNPDTDGDGIPDGYEVFYLGTDPTKADSDDNGKNDGDEDFDNDGLSNKKEYELGTDPNNADTDGDGLSDGAEVNTHGTDPLKYDTDEDGISDGDELKLGLDPKNSSTDGTPDSERTFPQTISSDSEVLSEINNDEEMPFKVSLEIKAAGVAENNVYARESGYSNAIKNSAIIGTAPEFVYTDGLSVEEVTVKFELESSAVSNTLGTYVNASGEFNGIDRLNIFMFIEEVNMLLPVETFRDESTNTVYTTTDRMGTYCLVDMELWLNLLGIKPNNDNISQKVIDNFSALAYNGNNTESVNAANTFDVVFMVDQVNYSDEQLKVIQDSIAETSAAIWKRTPEATVVIYGYNGDGRTHFKKYGRSGAENPEALNAMLNRLVHVNSIGTVVLSKALDDLITESGISKNRIYCFTFFDSVKDYTEALPSNSKDVLNDIHDGKYDINISVVSNIPEESKNNSEGKECYATALYNQTNGISIDVIDFVEKSLKHIYGENSNQFGAYNAIIATGYHTIVLDAPITIEYREAAEDVKKNPQNLERYKKSGMADTDKDGLLDFQEINFEIYGKDGLLVQFDEKGNIKELPLATVCSDLYVNTKGKDGEKTLTYVENGWKAFEDSIYYSDLSKIHILPIISDPTSVDGDGDGILDRYDEKSLIDDRFPSLFVNYINSGKIDFKDVLCSAERDVFVCRKSISDLGFVAQITPLFYYDEYGDPVEFEDEASAVAVQQGFFTDWYILGLSSEAECLYTVIYSEDIVESVDSFNQPKFIKSIRRAVDKFAAPYKVIIESISEDGVASTAKELAMGLASAFLEDNALKLGKSFGTLVDLLSGNIGYDSTGNFDNFNEFQFNFNLGNLGNKTPSVKFENQLYRGYLNLEREYFDTENDVYKASKSIFCQLNCIVDLLTAVAGVGLSDIGTKTFIAGGAVTVLSDGSTAIVSIPAMIVGALESAQGYQIAVASVLTLAENVNTFSTLNDELSEGFKNGDLAANLKQAVKARIKKYDTVKYKYKLEEFDGYDKGSHSKILEKQLEKQGIKKPKYGVGDGNSGCAAHHIVPTNDNDCPVATELLKKYEIDKDSAANGVFLPTKKTKYVSTEAIHAGRNSRNYCNIIEEKMIYVKEEIEGLKKDQAQKMICDALQELRKGLLNGSIVINNA